MGLPASKMLFHGPSAVFYLEIGGEASIIRDGGCLMLDTLRAVNTWPAVRLH